jgi:predicted component of type VI protein secretion system
MQEEKAQTEKVDGLSQIKIIFKTLEGDLRNRMNEMIIPQATKVLESVQKDLESILEEKRISQTDLIIISGFIPQLVNEGVESSKSILNHESLYKLMVYARLLPQGYSIREM